MGMTVYHNHQSQKGGIKEKMNTIRKIKHDVKALSPVVASIILIAVTVAVSIAVAAWMGALVVGQMSTEEVKIIKVDFSGASDDAVGVTMKNTGTTPVTITEVRVNNGDDLLTTDLVLAANEQSIANITSAWIAGSNYQIKAMSSKGNVYLFIATAPQ